jgi:polyhydroxybutyrate depolymerase
VARRPLRAEHGLRVWRGQRTARTPNAVRCGSLRFVLAAVMLAASGCKNESVELGRYDYSLNPTTKRCSPGSLAGAVGASNGERSALDIGFNVRTPQNYDATVAHPLLMVFAPSGASRFASEALTGFTLQATTLGFVVAYADSRRMSIPNIEALGSIPALVAKKWCIDESRVYYAGHSDGGTVAMALAILPQMLHKPTGIAASAAGFTKSDLAGFACPSPLRVVVLHSREDTLFNGYGSQMARWWAECNKCDAVSTSVLANGCIAFNACKAQTVFCEGHESHERWPDRNETILKLFTKPEDILTAGRK